MAQIACWWYIIIRLPLTSRNPNSCSHPPSTTTGTAAAATFLPRIQGRAKAQSRQLLPFPTAAAARRRRRAFRNPSAPVLLPPDSSTAAEGARGGGKEGEENREVATPGTRGAMGTPFIYCHRSGDGSSTPRPPAPFCSANARACGECEDAFCFFLC
jgi:hypothetical protein